MNASYLYQYKFSDDILRAHFPFSRPKKDCHHKIPYIFNNVSIRIRTLLLIFLSALLLSVPDTVLAYNDKGQDWINFPTVTVISNGQAYTHVEGIGYGWEGRFWLEAGWNARVKKWRVWPTALSLAPSDAFAHRPLSLEIFDAHKSYAPLKRPKSVNKTVGTLAPGHAFAAWAVGACNDKAAYLRDDGKSDQWIFSRNHEVDVHSSLAIDAEFSAGQMQPQEAASSNSNSKIICKKWSGAQVPAAGDLKTDNEVKNATLTVLEQYGPGGLCQLTLSGIIETAHPNTQVKFRYAGGNGHKTSTKTVSTDHSRTVFFSHEYQIANALDGDESGSVRIEGVSTPFESSWQSYSMQCVAPGATGLMTELPPELRLQVTPVDNQVIDGQICPSRLRLHGSIKARSDLDAKMLFVGSNFFSPVHPVDQGNGQIKSYIDFRELSWQSGKPLELTTQQPDTEPMKSQQVQIGFNVFNEGKVIAQVPWNNYRITCTKPAVNKDVGDSAGAFSTNVAVLQSSLTVVPQTSQLGKCGVKLVGSVTTNVANAKVTVAYRNHMGVMTPARTVTTNAQKKASFQDTLDFSKSGKGLWVDQSGKIGQQGGSQAGNYSGFYQLVGTRPVFQSSQKSYDFNCVDKAPGDIAKNPSKPKPAFTAVGPLVNPSSGKPSKQPGSKRVDPDSVAVKNPKTDSVKRAPQMTVFAAQKETRDIVVEKFVLALKPMGGTAVGVIANHGTVKTTFRYNLVVLANNGKRVGHKEGKLTLAPGASATVKHAFRSQMPQRYAGSLSVAARGDQNTGNNIKKTRGSY